MDDTISLPDLPVDLRWATPPERWTVDGTALTVSAQPRTDLFTDPDGTGDTDNAPHCLATTTGDYLFGARVRAGFAATFDAGVLLLYAHEGSWAKLCFEYSPRKRPTIVSVVTRGVSDDCNSFEVDGDSVWLRIARLGPAFAFHASIDGSYWSLVRYFALDPGTDPRVGLLAQSPTGDGCTITFVDVRYEPRRLPDLRDGT